MLLTENQSNTYFQLCLLLQRYTFWSNSQQSLFAHKLHGYCACYCKDTHFEAIHNRWAKTMRTMLIVLATAKIHILKQFTTKTAQFLAQQLLCLLLQRYTFWSNSQLCFFDKEKRFYCACYCKDTHFEAIHNYTQTRLLDVLIVLATAKIHILKQFTTHIKHVSLTDLLCLLLQRYTFWSNSQLALCVIFININCACYCKDTHFEAIHNCTPICCEVC